MSAPTRETAGWVPGAGAGVRDEEQVGLTFTEHLRCSRHPGFSCSSLASTLWVRTNLPILYTRKLSLRETQQLA